MDQKIITMIVQLALCNKLEVYNLTHKKGVQLTRIYKKKVELKRKLRMALGMGNISIEQAIKSL